MLNKVLHLISQWFFFLSNASLCLSFFTLPTLGGGGGIVLAAHVVNYTHLCCVHVGFGARVCMLFCCFVVLFRAIRPSLVLCLSPLVLLCWSSPSFPCFPLPPFFSLSVFFVFFLSLSLYLSSFVWLLLFVLTCSFRCGYVCVYVHPSIWFMLFSLLAVGLLFGFSGSFCVFPFSFSPSLSRLPLASAVPNQKKRTPPESAANSEVCQEIVL